MNVLKLTSRSFQHEIRDPDINHFRMDRKVQQNRQNRQNLHCICEWTLSQKIKCWPDLKKS